MISVIPVQLRGAPPMSQRRADFIQSCFGEQSLAALQAQLCEQLPLGCFGTKVNDPPSGNCSVTHPRAERPSSRRPEPWPMSLPPIGCVNSCGKSCPSPCPRYANSKGGSINCCSHSSP